MSTKIACFIHSTHIEECGTVIIDDLINYLNIRDFFSKIDFLFINNIGIELDEDKYKEISEKIIIVNFSDDVSLFECCTIKQMITFSKLNPDYKILYLHTKGVSHVNNTALFHIIKSWSYYMLYSLVDKMNDCISVLDDYDTVGCNYQIALENNISPHYSGNFWWARASYLKKLNMLDFKVKHDAELKIFSKSPLWFNTHNLDNMYGRAHHINEYKNHVDNAFDIYNINKKSNITFCKFTDANNTSKLNIFSVLMSCIYSCINKKLSSEQFIILSPILRNNANNVSLKSIVNINYINETLKKNNIMIIDKLDLHNYISSITYGEKETNVIDVKDIVMNQYFKESIISIPDPSVFNHQCHDPVPGVFKYLYISYSFSKTVITDIYKEGEPVYINFISKLRCEENYNTFSHNNELINLLDMFDFVPKLDISMLDSTNDIQAAEC